MTNLICLRNFSVCVLVEEISTFPPSNTLYPHSVITLYDSLWISGSVIGRVLSESLLILLI